MGGVRGGGEVVEEKDIHRNEQDVKRRRVGRKNEGLHFSLWVQLEVFEGPGVRMCVRVKNVASLTALTFLTLFFLCL